MKYLIPTFAASLVIAATLTSCGSKDSSSEKDKGIIGKWEMTEETKAKQNEENGIKLENGTMEFTEDTIILSSKMDSSEFMALYDDKMEFNGMEFEILSYDNKVLSVGMDGEEVVAFNRKEESEDMYGDYELPDELKTGNEEGFFTFEKEGVSYATISETHTYSYDEETGELRLTDDEDSEPDKIELDGDSLTFTNDSGEEQFFERVD